MSSLGVQKFIRSFHFIVSDSPVLLSLGYLENICEYWENSLFTVSKKKKKKKHHFGENYPKRRIHYSSPDN